MLACDSVLVYYHIRRFRGPAIFTGAQYYVNFNPSQPSCGGIKILHPVKMLILPSPKQTIKANCRILNCLL